MYEATQTDIGSQFVRIPTDDSWIDLLSQQTDSTRQIPGCNRRTTDQTAKSKEVSTWMTLPRV